MAETQKFTPGPWQWSGVPGASDLVNDAGDAVIRYDSYEGMWFSRYNEEDAANASLIADAPDMLAALKEIAEGKGRFSQDPFEHACNTIEEMKAIANAALSKAEVPS